MINIPNRVLNDICHSVKRKLQENEVSLSPSNLAELSQTMKNFLEKDAGVGVSPELVGHEEALDSIKLNPELKLWEVEVGAYDMDEDPSTPQDTKLIYVATESIADAEAESKEKARSIFDGLSLEVMATPELIR